MYLPDLLRDREEMLLPRKICIGCVKAILNWADFSQRSLNLHNYFMKLLSRDFEISKDNSELVNFIRTTKEEFSLTLVRSISRLSPQGRVLLQCSAPTINTSSKKAPPLTNTSSKTATTVIDSPPNKALNLLYRSCDRASLNNEISPVKKGESILRKPTSELKAVDRLSVEQDSADPINTSSKKQYLMVHLIRYQQTITYHFLKEENQF
ncbi:uncharacterized protein LOC120353043 [Nilaparvata lugens]|uniref:uncharacterized protein LOC120353043 n=1 Tax=Nilaparvata lugens TaxID=108931 RepID=UPI00193DD225|nr:uncharacterized protein LOC120353043 [Nilaparvata lugens]